MNDHEGHTETSPCSSPRRMSPEPSVPLYGQVDESRRVYSTATKSRTQLPPGTPLDERRGLESLKQRMKFEEADTLDDTPDEEDKKPEVSETPLAIHRSPGEESDADETSLAATAVAATSTALEDSNSQHVDFEQAGGDGEAEKEAVIQILLLRLKEAEELLQKASGIRDGMLQVQHEGGDIDNGQMQRLEAMIEQLSEERQKYRILLVAQLPSEEEREAAQQEREARELAALQEQKELLLKLVDQQKKLRELEERQASLLALQQSASSRLEEAKEMRAGLEAQAEAASQRDDDDEDNIDEEIRKDEDAGEGDGSEQQWKERLQAMEKKQETMERLLQRLLAKGPDDRDTHRDDESLEEPEDENKETTTDATAATITERLQRLDDVSSQIMELRNLMKQVEEVQDEAELAAVAAGALPGQMESLGDMERERLHAEEEEEDEEEEVDVDVASLDFLLSAEIDDPELKEQIQQLQERRARIEELQRQLDRGRPEGEASEKAESENEDADDYIDMSGWDREDVETKLRRLEVARTKLSKLQRLAKLVQDQAGQIAVHRSGSSDSETELIGQEELDGLSAMLEDYIEKLARKREEFDELVDEQRQLLAVVDGDEGQQGQDAAVEDRQAKGDLASNTLLWTELQRKQQLQKELREKKKEIALLQAMASEQDRKVEFAKSAAPGPAVSESSRSADATMATWGGSTQISAESLQDHVREGRSDSDSLLGAARHRIAVGRPRRVRRWPDEQQYLPGKKKKRLVEHESPVLKEESKGAEAADTDLFATSRGYSAAWPSIIFPVKPDSSEPAGPTGDTAAPPSDQPAMSRQQEEDFQWEQRCQHLHQQLLQSTTLCNNLLREQLALSQLIQDGGSRPHWYVQEYMQRLQESSELLNQQQQHVMHLQQELSRLYSLRQRNGQQKHSPLTRNVSMQPGIPPYQQPFSPFPSPYFNPFYPYSPWGNVYPGHYGSPLYPGYAPPGIPGAFPSGTSQELPSTTQTVYPAGTGDDARSNRTYSVDSSPQNGAVTNEGVPDVDVDISYQHGRGKATAVTSMAARKVEEPRGDAGMSLARKARQAALVEVKGKAKGSEATVVGLSKMIDALSLSSAQSSIPGDGGVEESDYSLFEALRESIYAEVAALISQNESRPHFLIELFRELQLLSSDYLRQRALYAIQDLVTRYLTEDSVQPLSTAEANIPDSYFQPWLASASEHTPSESAHNEEQEEEEAVAAAAMRAKRYQKGNFLVRAANARSPEVYDYQENADSASSLTTPHSGDEHPFAKDTLGDSVIHYERPSSQHKLVVSRSAADGTAATLPVDNESDSESGFPEIDTQSLDHQIKSIITEVIPVLKDRMDEICSPQLLSYIQALVLTLVQDKEEKDGASKTYSSQLGSTIQDSLAKFTGRKMSECGEELLVELSEVLFNEMAFMRLMQEISRRPKTRSAEEAVKSESDSSMPEITTQPAEKTPSIDDFTFSDGGEESVASGRRSEEVVSSNQLQREEEDLGKARDDALAVTFDFPSRLESSSAASDVNMTPKEVNDDETTNTDDEKRETTGTDETLQAAESLAHPPVSSHCPQEEDGFDHHVKEKRTSQQADGHETDVSPIVREGGSDEKLEHGEVVEECGGATAAAAVVQTAEQKDDEMREKYEAEQAEHQGISAVLKEVETQPELAGDDDNVLEPTMEGDTANETE